MRGLKFKEDTPTNKFL